MSRLQALLRTRSLWLVIVAVIATIVIEGFALSWGANSPRFHGPTTTAGRTVATPNVCAKGAKFRFIQVDYFRYGGGSQQATVTGHVVRLHCGGPDDLQYLVGRTPETVNLRAGAKITLLTLAPSFYIGTLKQLNNYLARDEDGNIFLVAGSNSGATALTAMFHP